MAWIETHQSLLTHRKTYEAADLLEIKPVYLVGHLVSLWCWCLDNAPDGTLKSVSPRIIARAAQWDDDPNTFVNALVAAGYLDVSDDTLTIHDWWDYAGKLIDRRQANAAKQRDWRDRRNSNITVTSPLRNGATVPNPTQPYPTQPNLYAPPEKSEIAKEASADAASGEKADFPEPVLPEAPTTIETPKPEPAAKPSKPKPNALDNVPPHSPENIPKIITPRPDQLMYSALADALGAPLTASARGVYNKAGKELRDAGVLPEEIPRLVTSHRQRWKNIDVTATSLAKNLVTLRQPVPANGGGRPVDRSVLAHTQDAEMLEWLYQNNPGLREAENARQSANSR
jgi:hypothetical protein